MKDKKYKFEEGDGLCMFSTSRDDRREMHYLLDELGYKMNIPSEKRAELCWDRSLEFFKGMWVCSNQTIPGNSYTYDQMYSKILTKRPLLEVGLKVVGATLVLWIEYQDTSIPRGTGLLFEASNGIEISSGNVLDASEDSLYIEGTRGSEDVILVELETIEEALELKARLKVAIEEFNNKWTALPTLKLAGANKNIKFAIADSDTDLYGYSCKPTVFARDGFWMGDVEFPLITLDQDQLNPLLEGHWINSLHKVEHIK